MEELLKSTTAYKILSGDRAADKLSHAYMLDFNDYTNLKSALKVFALGFFGVTLDSPLGQRVLNESYPDLKVYPQDGKKLTADAVNEILDDSALKPVEGSKKLYVISDFDSAPPLLQNKLLKTLEEPLEGIHFLLGACSLAPVLDTVKSRVKTLTVPPFSDEQIFAALEREGKNPLNAAAAKSAQGVLGAAQNIVRGGWFKEVYDGAVKLCCVTHAGEIGALAAEYGETKYKNELLREMQRLYFAALCGGAEVKIKLERPALIYASEKLVNAFSDVKFNANFQGLLYDFLLGVVKENEKWQQLLR